MRISFCVNAYYSNLQPGKFQYYPLKNVDNKLMKAVDKREDKIYPLFSFTKLMFQTLLLWIKFL